MRPINAIIITDASPEEIAALALAVQERQKTGFKLKLGCKIPTEVFRSAINGIHKEGELESQQTDSEFDSSQKI